MRLASFLILFFLVFFLSFIYGYSAELKNQSLIKERSFDENFSVPLEPALLLEQSKSVGRYLWHQ